ncbi:ankyrin and het domain protein [Colletotrichum truncatum]|uniref:Ankyrin and het domain protein n=1 Tax=Colletotrichum truncatum TaxID=5467 RepID=A0ACC3YKJ5_COLTU|nr:ankyrin and het domain protein [Colletotrichum truncatum]KAF6783394.1 ankyrin and het domain protein [Colletotrichum truncatum]
MADSQTLKKGAPELFTYPSAVGADSIRVVKICPAGNDPTHLTNPAGTKPQIELLIKTVAFEDRPVYHALSYTWGAADFDTEPSRDTVPIILGGKTFYAMQNLHDGLLQLRESFPDTWFWIDAICINQDDLTERSTQVSIMDDVYTNAHRTVVWLGKAKPGIPRAFEVIAEVMRRIEEEAGLSVWVAISNSDFESLRGVEMPELTLDDWRCVTDLYARRWFWRMWVVQEVALSTTVDMLSGDTTMPWDVVGGFAALTNLSGILTEAYVRFPELTTSRRDGTLGLGVATQIYVLRSLCRMKQGEDEPLKEDGIKALLDFLGGTMLFDVTDARDRIYGLFGILKFYAKYGSFDVSWATVDYRSTAPQVYTTVAENIITSSRRLDIICWTGKAVAKLEGLPSWVPDWGRRTVGYPREGSGQDASNSLAVRDLSFEVRDSKLFCRGLKIGAVVAVGERQRQLHDGDFRRTASILMRLPARYTHTGQPRVEALWRTLLRDRKSHEDEKLGASDDMGAAFKVWALQAYAQGAGGSLKQPGAKWMDIVKEAKVCDELAASDETRLFPSTDDLKKRLGEMGWLGKESELPLPSEEEKQKTIKSIEGGFFKWGSLFNAAMEGRQLALLEGDYLANLPDSLDVGDEVWVVQGCHLPLLMRKGENGDGWVILRDAYVHGIMSGEAVTQDIVWEDICIR